MSSALILGAHFDMVVAGILSLLVIALAGSAWFMKNDGPTFVALPLSILAVGMMISVAIVKSK